MFDTSKLRGRIIEKYGSQLAFSNAVKRTNAFISNVLNSKTYLEQKDIAEWADVLDISMNDIGIYFFTPIVHETEQR